MVHSASATSPGDFPTSSTIRNLALRAVEVIYGLRPLEQVSRFVDTETMHQLHMQRKLQQEKHSIEGGGKRIVPMPGRVVSSALHSKKLHATVVMHTPERSFSMVVRIERELDRWRATELMML